MGALWRWKKRKNETCCQNKWLIRNESAWLTKNLLPSKTLCKQIQLLFFCGKLSLYCPKWKVLLVLLQQYIYMKTSVTYSKWSQHELQLHKRTSSNNNNRFHTNTRNRSKYSEKDIARNSDLCFHCGHIWGKYLEKYVFVFERHETALLPCMHTKS